MHLRTVSKPEHGEQCGIRHTAAPVVYEFRHSSFHGAAFTIKKSIVISELASLTRWREVNGKLYVCLPISTVENGIKNNLKFSWLGARLANCRVLMPLCDKRGENLWRVNGEARVLLLRAIKTRATVLEVLMKILFRGRSKLSGNRFTLDSRKKLSTFLINDK